MKASEFIYENDEQLYEAEVVWGRTKGTSRGGLTKLTYRCTSGPRKSRQVSQLSKCFDHPNVAQAQKMKTTRARTAPTQARRQQRTKSINTASSLASGLNKKGVAKQPTPWY
jgi:hypothetical protein